MEIKLERTHPISAYLYLGKKFNNELEKFGVHQVSDIENISLFDILSFKTITIARHRTVVLFMRNNGLRFEDTYNNKSHMFN